MAKKTVLKNPTRELKNRVATQHKLIEFKTNQINALQNELGYRNREIDHLKAKMQEKVDTSMVEARNKLAYSLGQMTEAISKAIVAIVAKEVM